MWPWIQVDQRNGAMRNIKSNLIKRPNAFHAIASVCARIFSSLFLQENSWPVFPWYNPLSMFLFLQCPPTKCCSKQRTNAHGMVEKLVYISFSDGNRNFHWRNGNYCILHANYTDKTVRAWISAHIRNVKYERLFSTFTDYKIVYNLSEPNCTISHCLQRWTLKMAIFQRPA